MESVLEKIKYKEVMTEVDGSFSITMYEKGIDSEEVLNYKYELVVTKLGYLDYTFTNIIIEGMKICDIGEYMLIAGDTNQNGYINIDDLVSTNNNFGRDKSVSDFNEDGVVDSLDGNILKKNYGKRAKIEEYKMGE